MRPLHQDVVEDARPTLILLMTGVGLLLLLACANVANLVLVRAIGRSGEVALRSALGAGRGRLVWHGASEVLVLVGAGALAAIPVAILGTSVIRRFAPEGVPRIETVRLDPPSLLFALGVTALAALLVSLAPARRIAKVDLRSALSGGSGRSVGTRRGLHRWLVALETAVALSLLAVAGMLLKSKMLLEQVNPGFDPGSTLTASVALSDKHYGKAEQIALFQNELLTRLRGINGVESAALVFGLPLTGFWYSLSFHHRQRTGSGRGQPVGPASAGVERLLHHPANSGRCGARIHGGGPARRPAGGGDQRGGGKEILARWQVPGEIPPGRGSAGTGRGPSPGICRWRRG
jgi:putative ABC transport system permease protein